MADFEDSDNKKEGEESLDKIKEEFEVFSKGIQRLEELKTELDSLPVAGNEAEIAEIRSKLKYVHEIPWIEKKILDLKQKISPPQVFKPQMGFLHKQSSHPQKHHPKHRHQQMQEHESVRLVASSQLHEKEKLALEKKLYETEQKLKRLLEEQKNHDPLKHAKILKQEFETTIKAKLHSESLRQQEKLEEQYKQRELHLNKLHVELQKKSQALEANFTRRVDEEVRKKLGKDIKIVREESKFEETEKLKELRDKLHEKEVKIKILLAEQHDLDPKKYQKFMKDELEEGIRSRLNTEFLKQREKLEDSYKQKESHLSDLQQDVKNKSQKLENNFNSRVQDEVNKRLEQELKHIKQGTKSEEGFKLKELYDKLHEKEVKIKTLLAEQHDLDPNKYQKFLREELEEEIKAKLHTESLKHKELLESQYKQKESRLNKLQLELDRKSVQLDQLKKLGESGYKSKISTEFLKKQEQLEQSYEAKEQEVSKLKNDFLLRKKELEDTFKLKLKEEVDKQLELQLAKKLSAELGERQKHAKNYYESIINKLKQELVETKQNSKNYYGSAINKLKGDFTKKNQHSANYYETAITRLKQEFSEKLLDYKQKLGKIKTDSYTKVKHLQDRVTQQAQLLKDRESLIKDEVSERLKRTYELKQYETAKLSKENELSLLGYKNKLYSQFNYRLENAFKKRLTREVNLRLQEELEQQKRKLRENYNQKLIEAQNKFEIELATEIKKQESLKQKISGIQQEEDSEVTQRVEQTLRKTQAKVINELRSNYKNKLIELKHSNNAEHAEKLKQLEADFRMNLHKREEELKVHLSAKDEEVNAYKQKLLEQFNKKIKTELGKKINKEFSQKLSEKLSQKQKLLEQEFAKKAEELKQKVSQEIVREHRIRHSLEQNFQQRLASHLSSEREKLDRQNAIKLKNEKLELEQKLASQFKAKIDASKKIFENRLLDNKKSVDELKSRHNLLLLQEKSIFERKQKQLADAYAQQAEDLKSKEILIRKEYENRYDEKVNAQLHKEVSSRFTALLHEKISKQEQLLKTAYDKKLNLKLVELNKVMKQHEQKIISLEKMKDLANLKIKSQLAAKEAKLKEGFDTQVQTAVNVESEKLHKEYAAKLAELKKQSETEKLQLKNRYETMFANYQDAAKSHETELFNKLKSEFEKEKYHLTEKLHEQFSHEKTEHAKKLHDTYGQEVSLLKTKLSEFYDKLEKVKNGLEKQHSQELKQKEHELRQEFSDKIHEKEELYEREKSFAVKYALDKQRGQLEKDFSERLKKELAKRRAMLAREISHDMSV